MNRIFLETLLEHKHLFSSLLQIDNQVMNASYQGEQIEFYIESLLLEDSLIGLITIIFFVNKKINLNIPSLLKIFATLMLAFIFKDINYPFFINTNDIHLFIAFLASLIIEQFNLYHKKEITFLTLSTYFLASLVLSSLEYISSDKIIELALNSNFIFAAIFVAPISYTSPNNQKERNTYCALIGISSAVLINIKSIFITPYLIIFIVSMIPFVTKILKLNSTKIT